MTITLLRKRGLAALLTVGCMLAALLALYPPIARADVVRTPADEAVVDSVPVLAWPAVTSATSYELQVSTSATFTTTVVSETRPTPSYVFTKDVAPGTYYWRYRAFAGDQSQLSVSPAWSFTRETQGGPTLLSPADGDVLAYPTDSPTLRWTPVPAYGSYEVQWDDNPDFRSPDARTTSATAYTIASLLPQNDTARIYWRVRALASVLSGVSGGWSVRRFFDVEWAETAPTLVRPADTDLVDEAVDQVVYEWTATAGAAKYELQVAVDNRFTTLVNPATGVDYPSQPQEMPFVVHGTRYVAPSRYPAKSHWWRVRALDAKGAPGPWSEDPAHFTRRWTQPGETLGTAVPARPNNVTVDPAVPINQFEVTWDAVPDTTYYEMEISTDPAFHDGLSVTCKTPHTYFAPAFEGGYKDAGREEECPILVPESAMPPFTESVYSGGLTSVTISGSGLAKDSVVILDFGAGDDQNGRYRVASVIPNDPATEGVDESAFTVALNRPGIGTVSWRPDPGLLVVPGSDYYLRVRAVHETMDGLLVYSVWSDQASYPDETPPGPVATNPAPESTGTSGLGQPAVQLAPASGSSWTDWPVLRWDAADGAEAYLVAIAKDREFTNSILQNQGLHFEYYVTRGTYFVPQTTLAENNAGGSYYWYVLPCQTFGPDDIDCATADREAILQSGRWRSFHKASNVLTSLSVTPADSEPWVQLSWDDTYQSSPNPATIGTGGFSRFEVQITDSTWDKAQTILTETPSLTTSELTLEPSSRYRWRVRAIDGGLLPLPWSEGTEFPMPSYPGPAGLATVNDRSPQPCLTWQPAAHASGYEVQIYRGTSTAYPGSANVQEATAAYPSYCPTGLAGGKYSWRVRSVHSQAGKSSWSPAVDAAVFEVEVLAPVLIAQPEPLTQGDLIFDWEPIAAAAKYTVELSTDDFWTVAQTVESVTDLWTPSALQVGDYAWRVKALDVDGNVLSTSTPAEVSVHERLTITAVKPKLGPPAGGTRVTVTGTMFDNHATVKFGTDEATVVDRTDDSITVTTPAHAPGPVDVTVTNPDSRSYTLPKAFTYVPTPVVLLVSPSVGPLAGGTLVTVSGIGFDPRAEVRWGTDRVAVVQRTGTTAIAVLTPAHAAGLVDVTVTNPDGQSTTMREAFTYLAAPQISRITPAAGPPGGGTLIAIKGSSFHPDAVVTIDGITAEVVDRLNTTEISATTPAHVVGPVDVDVTNPDGQSATVHHGFTYNKPPAAGGLTPAHGPTSGATLVTISGTDFHTNAVVTFDGTEARFTTRISDTSITAVTPEHAAGPVDVTVTNPDGQSTTMPEAFTYVAPPEISAVSPATGPLAGGTRLVVTGRDFDSHASVTMDGSGVAVTDRQGSTALVVTTPAHGAGPVDIVVTNPGGQSATALAGFTYVPAPAVAAVTPGSGPAAGGTALTVTGSGFHPSATVTVGGTRAAITDRRGSTGMTATTPAHPTGAVDIVVTNPDGQAVTVASAFTYIAAPVVTRSSPATGPTAGGTVLTIVGTDFHAQATVTIGGVSATVTVRQGSTGIVVTTPPHVAGLVDILVTNPDGQVATSAKAFTYVEAPAISAVSPDSGPSSGYTRVTITGTNFSGNAMVAFDDSDVDVVDRQGSTELTVLSPAHSAGAVDIIVENPDGQESVAKSAFTFELNAQADTDSAAPPWFTSRPKLRVVGQKLRVRWSRPSSLGSPADNYLVLVKISDTATFEAVDSTSRRLAKISVRRGRTYWVRIAAHSAAGWGEPGPAARRRVR